jgi:hypothetical protein
MLTRHRAAPCGRQRQPLAATRNSLKVRRSPNELCGSTPERRCAADRLPLEAAGRKLGWLALYALAPGRFFMGSGSAPAAASARVSLAGFLAYTEAHGALHEPNSWHGPSANSIVMRKRSPEYPAPAGVITGETNELTGEPNERSLKLTPSVEGWPNPSAGAGRCGMPRTNRGSEGSALWVSTHGQCVPYATAGHGTVGVSRFGSMERSLDTAPVDVEVREVK